MRFDLHDDGPAVADVDRAGVLLTHARKDAVAAAGEEAEEGAAVLVAAVLAPERAEDAELDLVRLASQPRDERLVLVAAQRDGVQRRLFDGHAYRLRARVRGRDGRR